MPPLHPTPPPISSLPERGGVPSPPSLRPAPRVEEAGLPPPPDPSPLLRQPLQGAAIRVRVKGCVGPGQLPQQEGQSRTFERGLKGGCF